jgi:hypothetical protein
LSIASLTNHAYERDTGRPWRARDHDRQATSPTAKTIEASKVEILVRFLPTEILAGYLAAVAS